MLLRPCPPEVREGLRADLLAQLVDHQLTIGLAAGLALAALWKLPVVLICENNQYSMGTPLYRSLAVEDVSMRALAHGMARDRFDGDDVIRVKRRIGEAVARARETGEPTLIDHAETRGIHCRTFHIDPSGRRSASTARQTTASSNASSRPRRWKGAGSSAARSAAALSIEASQPSAASRERHSGVSRAGGAMVPGNAVRSTSRGRPVVLSMVTTWSAKASSSAVPPHAPAGRGRALARGGRQQAVQAVVELGGGADVPAGVNARQHRVHARFEQRPRLAGEVGRMGRIGSVRRASRFFGRLRALFSGKKELSSDLAAQIEEVLLTSDVGVETTSVLLERVEVGLHGASLLAALGELALVIVGHGLGRHVRALQYA